MVFGSVQLVVKLGTTNGHVHQSTQMLQRIGIGESQCEELVRAVSVENPTTTLEPAQIRISFAVNSQCRAMLRVRLK